jgi:hypothetical protein
MHLKPSLILLFTCCLVYGEHSIQDRDASRFLLATWRNQERSIMEITSAAGGVFSGRYQSLVGNARGWYPVFGVYTPSTSSNSDDPNFTLAFSVSWNNPGNGNSHSSCAWSGQVLDGLLMTKWLLTRQSEDHNAWSNTIISFDDFRRVMTDNTSSSVAR